MTQNTEEIKKFDTFDELTKHLTKLRANAVGTNEKERKAYFDKQFKEIMEGMIGGRTCE